MGGLRTWSRSLARARNVAFLPLFAGALTLAGCTDPVFTPTPDASLDAGGPGDIQGTEAKDAGADLPDTGALAPAGEECEGGPCRSVDGSAPWTHDGGAGDAGPGADAGDAALDPVRAKWAGHYATRSALFTFDDPFKGSARLLSLVDIVPTPDGGLRLEEQLCDFEGDWTFFVTGVLKYQFVEAHGSAALTYDVNGFDAEQMTLQIGYGPAPAGCTPGATMMKGEGQVWLTTSTCDCPRSEDPPTSARDCRVIDPEADREPGATFSAAVDASPIVFRVVQEERVRLLKGYRLGDRLYADRWFEDTTHILSCILNGVPTLAANCPLGAAKSCPSRHNKVEFVSLKEPLTCAQVIAMELALFLSPLPNYPETCPSEVAAPRRP